MLDIECQLDKSFGYDRETLGETVSFDSLYRSLQNWFITTKKEAGHHNLTKTLGRAPKAKNAMSETMFHVHLFNLFRKHDTNANGYLEVGAELDNFVADFWRLYKDDRMQEITQLAVHKQRGILFS